MPPATQSLKYTHITQETFNAILSRYPSTVPEKLRELDVLRYDTIPAAVAARAKEGGAELTKDEVVRLVEWKLKHGTFRPKLLSLIHSNSPTSITTATRTAFSSPPPSTTPATNLKPLTTLSGIGPATASLLLSVAFPATQPFFSDEVYRWVMWDEPGQPGGWKRGIKYTGKEYGEVARGVGELRGRLEGVEAWMVERVAYVLGRGGFDVGVGLEEGEEDGGVVVEGGHGEEDGGKKKAKAKAKTGVKRKAGGVDEPVEGLRRSNRRKAAS